jgi:hypothetical protein
MAGVSSGPDKLLERASYLAILSIGPMLYYTGRSHWLVLRFVVWPEVILLFYLADQSIRNTGASAKLATIGTAVFLPLAATVFFWPVWSDTVLRMWKPAPESELVEQDISFLRSLTTPGEKIAIIAENQSTFYAATDTWPSLRGPSRPELQLVRDRDALIAKEGPKKLFTQNPSPTSRFLPAGSISNLTTILRQRVRAAGWYILSVGIRGLGPVASLPTAVAPLTKTMLDVLREAVGKCRRGSASAALAEPPSNFKNGLRRNEGEPPTTYRSCFVTLNLTQNYWY